MDKFGRFTVGLVIVALWSLWSTFVTMTVWNWFAPVLLGLKVLTFAQTYALTLLFAMFKGSNNSISNQVDESWDRGQYLEFIGKTAWNNSCFYGGLLIVAYILRSFI